MNLRWKRKLRPTKEQALASFPVRNGLVEWKEVEGGEVLITIQPRADRWTRWIKWLFPPPPPKQIALDEVGAEVWRACDGNTTVEQIIKRMVKRYKLNRKEAETSTTEYLRRLGKRRLVGFMVPDKTARVQS